MASLMEAAARGKRPREVVILGGGISGLTTAWSLVRASAGRSFEGSAQPPPRITILEPSSKTGGMLSTVTGPGGLILEEGPRTIRPGGAAGRATLNLVASIGMENELLVAGANHPGTANRYVYAQNRLMKLPSGPLEIATKVLQGDFLSRALATAMVKEPFSAKANPVHFSDRDAVNYNDESVFDFASRRLNRDVAAYMMDPLCVGIFGGDAKKLSLKSCFPSIAEFEELEGSLMLGAIRQDANTPALPPPEPGTEALLKQVEGARVWALQRGIGSLPEALENWLLKTGNVTIERGVGCRRLRQHPDKATLSIELTGRRNGHIDADHVVSTLSPAALAPIVKADDAACTGLLAEMPKHSCVVVNFVFRGNLAPVEGFGYLVPTIEPDNDILGVVFDSAAFPIQDDAYHLGTELGSITRLTVMSGGYNHSHLYGDGDIDEEFAVRVSRDALRKQLGITATPMHASVRPWVDCMPQYNIGHAARRDRLTDHVTVAWDKRLTMIGNAFHGVGVNDCVLKATATGKDLIKHGRA